MLTIITLIVCILLVPKYGYLWFKLYAVPQINTRVYCMDKQNYLSTKILFIENSRDRIGRATCLPARQEIGIFCLGAEYVN